MWIKKFLQKKRQHSEEMYWRWVYGLMGLSMSILIWSIAIVMSFK